MTFVADADVVDEQSTGGSYPAGTLYKKDGTRYRMSEGKLQWMSDRNGNLINFESTDPTRPGVTDPWGRPLAVYDALGRKIQIDYGGTGNHPGEDRITYPGYPATASEVTHTAYIRFDSLANRLIAGESLQKVEDLFPGSKIVGYANQNQDYNNPVLVSEVELADGRKFSFRYNRYAELAEVRLHTGGYVRYEWAGYTAAGDGLYGNLLIYRRLKTRKVYDSDGATLLSQSEYVCPNLEQQSSVQVLVTAIEKDSAGMELRRTEHTFHGGPISAASVAPMSFPGWREGREYNTKVKEAGGTVLQEVQQGWQQRGPANTSITPSTEIAPPNDPRITQTTTTLGALSAVRTYVYSVDEHNNLAQQCEKDYGAGTPTRCTDWTLCDEPRLHGNAGAFAGAAAEPDGDAVFAGADHGRVELDL